MTATNTFPGCTAQITFPKRLSVFLPPGFNRRRSYLSLKGIWTIVPVFTFLRPRYGPWETLASKLNGPLPSVPSFSFLRRAEGHHHCLVLFFLTLLQICWFIHLPLQQAFNEHLFCAWQCHPPRVTREKFNRIRLSRCSLCFVLVGDEELAWSMNIKDI